MKMQSEQRLLEAEWSHFTPHLTPLNQGSDGEEACSISKACARPLHAMHCECTAEASDSGQTGLFSFW